MNDANEYQPDYGHEFEVTKSSLMLARGVWRVYDWDGTHVELVPIVLGEPYWLHIASVPRWFAAKLWLTGRRTTSRGPDPAA